MTALTDHARRAHDSDWLDRVARAGLVAYAIVYLMIAWLAFQLALGDREGTPSSTGALRELAQQPLGSLLIWLVSAGLVLLAIWQGLEAAVGHRDEEHRVRKRLGSAAKTVVYAVIAVSGVRIAIGSGSSGKGEQTATARLMSLPAGQALVVLVGLVIIGVGVFHAWRSWTADFADQLDQEGRAGRSGRALLAAGRAGYAARGVAFVIVGGLFCYAGLTHEATKSGGLDQALLEVLDQPLGPLLLGLVALGLACFGVFTLARAKHLSR